MFGIGLPELIIILIVALLVVGPKKLPEVARSIGRALGEFRRMADDVKESLDQEINREESLEEHQAGGLERHQAEGLKDPAPGDETRGSEAGEEAPGKPEERRADDPYGEQYDPAGAKEPVSGPNDQKGA